MVSGSLDLLNELRTSLLLALSDAVLEVIDSHCALSVLVHENNNEILIAVRKLNFTGHYFGNCLSLITI